MKYTNYLFEPEDINETIAEVTANLKNINIDAKDVEKYAIDVIHRRLNKDPMRYRDYGMYWGALKEVLRKHGYDFGLPVFPFISDTYKGKTDIETVVMADTFRTFYLSHYAIGTNAFVLNDLEPQIFTFIDEDMENLIA